MGGVSLYIKISILIYCT